MVMQDSFRRFSRTIADRLGSNWAFLIALIVVVAWGGTGPLFGFSDTWQLVINTGTTIVTFLMVFLIQNTQNRDAMAMQVKLDELLRAITEARTSLVDLENRTDEELQRAKQELTEISREAGPLEAPPPGPACPEV
jgi:low affinity Fe/Cu permease